MAGTNQFVPFGTGAGANVLTAQSWAGLAARQSGFVDGIADTAQCNTAWRQPSVVMAMIGQFVADAGYDALDNGDLAALEANFRSAILATASGAIPGTALVHYGRDTSTVANSLTVPTVTPAISALTEGMLFEIVPKTTITGGAVISIGGQGPVTLSRKNATSLVAADLVANVPFLGMYLGGQVLVLGSVPSEIAVSVTNVINNKKIAGGVPTPFNAPGTYTIPVPNGTTFLVKYRGAGGGGGGGASLSAPGSGGGGGGYGEKVATATVDTVLTVTIGAAGAGGVGGSSPANGTAGGTTSVVVQSGSVTDNSGNVFAAGATLCAATGGGFGYAGVSSPQTTSAGSGGLSSGGDTNRTGQGGGFPRGPFVGGSFLGGSGGTSPLSGGPPGDNQGAPGNVGTAPGTGGSGSATNGPGGNGTDGEASIYK